VNIRRVSARVSIDLEEVGRKVALLKLARQFTILALRRVTLGSEQRRVRWAHRACPGFMTLALRHELDKLLADIWAIRQ